MNPSIVRKLEGLTERYEELQHLLGDPSVINDQQRFRALSKEYSQLEEVTQCFAQYQSAVADEQAAREMQQEDDAELRAMGADELTIAQQTQAELTEALQILLLPRDPNDDRPCYVEIRAGAGGDEAAIFAGDLFRMYSRYAEQQGWRVEVVSASHGEHGGYKEVIGYLSGDGAYGRMKFESGGHRVQRVPETESQGRVHTSACSVAVLVDDSRYKVSLPRTGTDVEQDSVGAMLCIANGIAHRL